jgi:hypothetical protein
VLRGDLDVSAAFTSVEKGSEFLERQTQHASSATVHLGLLAENVQNNLQPTFLLSLMRVAVPLIEVPIA